jgi:hypothetical protein
VWTKIALKYCGGCDPEYDRRAAVTELKEKLGGLVEWVRPDSGHAEAVIVVQGCLRACADLSELPKVPMVVIASLEQAQKLVEFWVGEQSQPDGLL